MRRSCLHIAPCTRADRSALLGLMSRSRWTHCHLDFIDAADWLAGGDNLLLLAREGGQLVGWLGLSPAIDGWRWIRLLGIRDGRMPGSLLRELWAQAERHCRQNGDKGVMLLAQTNWLGTYLAALDFRSDDQLIAMQHIGSRLPRRLQSPASLRQADAEDLDCLWQLDSQAFAPRWQIEREDLRRALRLAYSATLARVNGRIVGYQVCARHGGIAHVARLAVHPACQGQGVASRLLHDLLRDLLPRDFREITVNTQRSNLRSQRLYARFGFMRSGKDYPVWHRSFPPSGERA